MNLASDKAACWMHRNQERCIAADELVDKEIIARQKEKIVVIAILEWIFLSHGLFICTTFCWFYEARQQLRSVADKEPNAWTGIKVTVDQCPCNPYLFPGSVISGRQAAAYLLCVRYPHKWATMSFPQVSDLCLQSTS